MDLVYTPDEGPERVWNLKPMKMLSPEAELIESVGNGVWETHSGWSAKLPRGNSRAERAALWILLRRDAPGLAFDDVVIAQDQLIVKYDIDEKRQIRANVLENDALDADERDTLIRALGEIGDDPAPLEEPSSRSDSQPSGQITPPSEPNTVGP